MPIQALPHKERGLAKLRERLPNETFLANQIADDCDCTSCVVVHRAALSIHGKPVYERLLVKGDLRLRGDQELRRLPNLLAVIGTLDLSDCSKLELVSEGLYVGDNADFSRTPITELPAKTIVEQKLVVDGCEELREIGEATFCSSLSASGATKLRLIPGNREYLDLDLSGTAITELPPGITVKRTLNLSGCRNLVRIPEGTTVGYELDLTGCTNLHKLPKSLQPRNLCTDTFSVTETSVLMPFVEEDDADMMLGRPARDVIRHHLLERLCVLDYPISYVRTTSTGSSTGRYASAVGLQTPAAGRLKAITSRRRK